MNGNPYMVPDHPDDMLIIASGDMKLNGDPTGGGKTAEGLIYGGSSCKFNGKPVIHGQIICKSNPDPPGSLDLQDVNEIDGELKLTYGCTGLMDDFPVMAAVERTWSHVW